jgi:hypothetical protein
MGAVATKPHDLVIEVVNVHDMLTVCEFGTQITCALLDLHHHQDPGDLTGLHISST